MVWFNLKMKKKNTARYSSFAVLPKLTPGIVLFYFYSHIFLQNQCYVVCCQLSFLKCLFFFFSPPFLSPVLMKISLLPVKCQGWTQLEPCTGYSLFFKNKLSWHIHTDTSVFAQFYCLSLFYLPTPQGEVQSTSGVFCGFQEGWTGFWLLFSPRCDLHELNGICFFERAVFGWKSNTSLILNCSKQNF